MESSNTLYKGISIQVSLSGYSFKVLTEEGELRLSGWMGAESLFTTPEFQHRYQQVAISLLTPKFCLVPEVFYEPSTARAALQEVCPLEEGDFVETVPVPSLASVLVYSNSIGESLSRVLSQTWADGYLHLVIAQGKSLRLANVFQAPDFTTAEYFLFLGLKQLQLNPEVSTVCFRTPLTSEARMSLYRYFKGVVQL